MKLKPIRTAPAEVPITIRVESNKRGHFVAFSTSLGVMLLDAHSATNVGVDLIKTAMMVSLLEARDEAQEGPTGEEGPLPEGAVEDAPQDPVDEFQT